MNSFYTQPSLLLSLLKMDCVPRLEPQKPTKATTSKQTNKKAGKRVQSREGGAGLEGKKKPRKNSCSYSSSQAAILPMVSEKALRQAFMWSCQAREASAGESNGCSQIGFFQTLSPTMPSLAHKNTHKNTHTHRHRHAHRHRHRHTHTHTQTHT